MKTVVFAYHNMGLAGLDALFNHGFDIAAVLLMKTIPMKIAGSVRLKIGPSRKTLQYIQQKKSTRLSGSQK